MGVSEKAAIVLNGDFVVPADIRTWTAEADVTIAADGGVNALMSLGVEPDFVAGDMDSIRHVTLGQFLRSPLVRLDDQDLTDFQKVIEFACNELGSTRIAVLAYEGNRVDHMLSTLFVEPPKGVSLRFVGRDAQAIRLGPGVHRLKMPEGNRLSLLPLGEVLIEASSGLKYDVSGITLAIGGRDGVSNVATEAEVELTITSGDLLAFVQRFEGEDHW